MIQAFLILCFFSAGPDWGFFGHRLINRVAVYTLPTEMIGWYKPNLDYITDHAVDPDKRRYATKHEAVRHYIDLDHWGEMPFDHMPRYWDKALALNLQGCMYDGRDTIWAFHPVPVEKWKDTIADYKARLALVRKFYLPRYYDDEIYIPCDTLRNYMPDAKCKGDFHVYLSDVFSAHGIVPYHLQAMQRRLTEAFRENNYPQVLRVSAELGHYIADACVPLHTTENYNGQLTDQVGIHAFWESRIPELFAIDEFDMVVGGAEYIEDIPGYFWNLVLTSHKEVDHVLLLEKELSKTYPSDKQYCYEDRLNQNIRTQCAEYALAYHLSMDKMVEERLRIAIKALGDAWYTAWIDAGQPVPPVQREISKRDAEDEALDKAVQGGKALGREHE